MHCRYHCSNHSSLAWKYLESLSNYAHRNSKWLIRKQWASHFFRRLQNSILLEIVDHSLPKTWPPLNNRRLLSCEDLNAVNFLRGHAFVDMSSNQLFSVGFKSGIELHSHWYENWCCRFSRQKDVFFKYDAFPCKPGVDWVSGNSWNWHSKRPQRQLLMYEHRNLPQNSMLLFLKHQAFSHRASFRKSWQKQAEWPPQST